MICPYCKAENIEGADNCANCGQALYGLDLPEAGQKYPLPTFVTERLEKLLPHAPDIVTVETSDPVALAVRRMQTENTGAILVMERGRLEGIITGSDILHKVAGPKADLNARRCSEVMTPEPVVFQASDSIAFAINKMSTGEYRHIPVERDGSLISVINVNDVFRFIIPYLL